jgi:hypothetical protein
MSRPSAVSSRVKPAGARRRRSMDGLGGFHFLDFNCLRNALWATSLRRQSLSRTCLCTTPRSDGCLTPNMATGLGRLERGCRMRRLARVARWNDRPSYGIIALAPRARLQDPFTGSRKKKSQEAYKQGLAPPLQAYRMRRWETESRPPYHGWQAACPGGWDGTTAPEGIRASRLVRTEQDRPAIAVRDQGSTTSRAPASLSRRVRLFKQGAREPPLIRQPRNPCAAATDQANVKKQSSPARGPCPHAW